MLTQHFHRVIQRIEEQWNSSNALPDLVRYMRVALLPGQEGKSSSQYLRLAELPALCCQAAGGEPEWADVVTAAWLCFYQAAHLMDSLQDQDEPEPWWAEAGAGIALNVASGLFFSASLILEGMHKDTARGGAAVEIVPEFYRSFLVMCNGQHRDLTYPEPSLEQYWQYAFEKSGAFFALACWAGARLATEDNGKLENMRKFGEHLGLLIQVRDDLEEFKPDRVSEITSRGSHCSGALPVVYSREVLPNQERHHLIEALLSAADNADAKADTLRLIDKSGASLYILTEIERHQQQALKALHAVAPESEAAAKLALLVESK